YKTGNFESARSRLAPAPPAAAEATLAEWLADPKLRGGDYWRQGVLYRLLLAHDPERRYEATSLHFEFLQPVRKPGKAPHYERHRLAPTPTEEATVLAQATAVDAAIRRHEFGPGCGQCLWYVIISGLYQSAMHNPFETIDRRLSTLETLLTEVVQHLRDSSPAKEVEFGGIELGQ
nr:hypothetical protein [Tanacetum cinerariifolium]